MTTLPAPPLTDEQQKLAEGCVALARRVARDLHKRGGLSARAAVEDLEAEAMHGVCLAASRFDPARGLKFSTLAHWYARGYAQAAIFVGGAVTLPSSVIKVSKRKKSQATRDATSAAVYARPIGGDSRDGDDAPGHRPACKRPGPAEEVERADTLAHMLGRLDPRSRRVVEARIVEGRRFDEIGAELGLSRERARQIEKKALEKLRRAARTPAK